MVISVTCNMFMKFCGPVSPRDESSQVIVALTPTQLDRGSIQLGTQNRHSPSLTCVGVPFRAGPFA